MDNMIQSIKTKLVVFGLDGCVSNDTWRRPFVHPALTGPAATAQFHEKCREDAAFSLGEKLVRYHLASNDFIVFCTARPFAYNEQTSEWIRRTFQIEPKKDFVALMRGDSDDRSELDVKKDQIQHLLNWTEQSGRQVTMAYDDKTDITEYYMSRGIPTVHLAGDSYTALNLTTPPDARADPPPGPVVQYPTTTDLSEPDNRKPNGYDLGGAALHQNMSISPTDFIVANGLTFLEGSIVQLIAEWHQMRNMNALHDAIELTRKIISMEEKT